jgi:predicted acyl esterase
MKQKIFHYRNNILFFFASIILILSGIGCRGSAPESFKSIMIPVKDGTNLATDLYFPNKKSKSYPAILIRTPYNKMLLKKYGKFYSKH